MKIILLSANTLTVPYPVYPIGLDYVAAAIPSHHQVSIMDLNDTGGKLPINRIKELQPDIIGISIRNIDNTDYADPVGFAESYKTLIAEIRNCSRARLVLGGSGFTIFPREFMEALGADYGVIGEGERLALLLEALEQRLDTVNIPGIITSDTSDNNRFKKSGYAKIPPPLTHLPDRKFNPQTTPHKAYYIRKGGMMNLQTKRGCLFRCIYCTYPYIEGRRMRLIPPEKVAAEALELKNAGAKYLFITDSAFNAHPEHSLAVAQEFIRCKLSLPWGAFFAPISPAAGYFDTLSQAGLTHVEFGTESLSNSVLKAYQKPFKVEQALAAHQAAISANLHIAHYFLLGGPGETRRSIEETLSNIELLSQAVFFFFCGIRIYPHTDLFDLALNQGQIQPSQLLLEPVFYRPNTLAEHEILALVQHQAQQRLNWIIGAGGEKTAKIIDKMHRRGRIGPLWEYLIR